MKRIIAMLLALACSLSLFGCVSQETPAPTQASTEATEEVTKMPTEETGEAFTEISTEATEEAATEATVKNPTKENNKNTGATQAQNKRPTVTKGSSVMSTKATKAPAIAQTKEPASAQTKASNATQNSAPGATQNSAPNATQNSAPAQNATQASAPQSNQSAGHEHTFGEWTLQEAASCIVEGREIRRCGVCGFAESRYLPMEDHKLNGQNMCKTCRKVVFDEAADLVELGVVSDSWYGSGAKANTPWDVKCWNGKVYKASGDYDKNSGATTIMAFDTATNIWDTSYKAKDQAIHGFVEIGGKLVAPGIDAQESWEYGNYYELGDDGKWQKVRNLPNGVHCFDMIECDGKVFAALGTETISNTVAVSEDGGKTFTFAPLYKDGKPYDLSAYEYSRTQELVKLNGTVYALVVIYKSSGSATWGIFRYEDGKMHYMAEGKNLLDGSEFSRKYFGGDFEFNGKCYLTARRLYAITDFSDPSSWQSISMPNSGKVSDAILHDGAIYVLSSRQDLNTKIYHVIIYKSTTGEPGSFEEVASYDYSGFPLSFDYDGEYFYVGCSLNSLDQSKVGMLLRVKPQK